MNKKTVILFSGKIGSGKNTAADIFKTEIEKHFKVNVKMDYFARSLKELCRDAFKPLTNFLNDIFLNLMKEKYLDSYSFDEIKNLVTHDYNWFEEKNPITRHILQIIGTDVVRGIDPEYWTKKIIENIKQSSENVILITDWRFPNEAEPIIKEFNTIEIRIERDIERNNSFNEHISEKALDDYEGWDIIIRNNYSLDKLKEEIHNLVTNNPSQVGMNIFSRFIK